MALVSYIVGLIGQSSGQIEDYLSSYRNQDYFSTLVYRYLYQGHTQIQFGTSYSSFSLIGKTLEPYPKVLHISCCSLFGIPCVMRSKTCLVSCISCIDTSMMKSISLTMAFHTLDIFFKSQHPMFQRDSKPLRHFSHSQHQSKRYQH